MNDLSVFKRTVEGLRVAVEELDIDKQVGGWLERKGGPSGAACCLLHRLPCPPSPTLQPHSEAPSIHIACRLPHRPPCRQWRPRTLSWRSRTRSSFSL